MKKVYLASPFFNDKEIGRLEAIKEILRAKGLEVFVPNEHQFTELEFGSMEWREAVFKSDVAGIDNANFVFAIICNGNYSDSGTAWEIGYAVANGKPVIVFNDTDKEINLMIADSLHALLTSYEEVAEYDFNVMDSRPYTNYVW